MWKSLRRRIAPGRRCRRGFEGDGAPEAAGFGVIAENVGEGLLGGGVEVDGIEVLVVEMLPGGAGVDEVGDFQAGGGFGELGGEFDVGADEGA